VAEHDPHTRVDEEIAEGYERDPDDDPARRDEIAAEDARELTRVSIATAAALIAIALALALLGVPGAESAAKGLVVGCGVAVLNLRLLANGSWALFRGRPLRVIVSFGASAVVLLASAAFVALLHRDWLLGYALGLALPAVAGFVYAVKRSG
jgi:hypothetical protein